MRQRADDLDIFGMQIFNRLKFRSIVLTLGAAYTIDADGATLLSLDPGGATRVITLPAAEEGLAFIINNIADAAEDLTINSPPATTIGTISQNEAALVFCSGGVWYVRLVGAQT